MRFREIERGWLTQIPDNFTLEFQTVDNIVTDWTDVLDGGQLLGDQDEPFSGEANLDFYIERMIVDYMLLAQPGGLSLTNVVNVWVGVAIVTNNVAQKADIPLAMTTGPFFGNVFREIPEVRRLLRVQPHKVGLYSPPASTDPAGATFAQLPGNDFQRFDIKGPIFLQKDEALVVIASQTGDGDAFPQWIDGDSVTVLPMAQFLIRKKKGR